MRKIAISDIHGCWKTFEKLIEKINLQKSDELYLLGDYVHRGDNSFKVLDFIFFLSENYNTTVLAGNHENMLINSIIERNKTENNKYFDYCCNLPIIKIIDNFVLIHSEFFLRFEIIPSNAYQMVTKKDWSILKEISPERIKEKTVISGHIIQSEERIRKRVANNEQIIIIDNGCYEKHKRGYGNLCAYDFSNKLLHFQSNID